MAKYRILFNGELEDEIFDTEAEADAHALYLCNCASQGAEDLFMSNPGDYPDDDADAEYEIIEVED